MRRFVLLMMDENDPIAPLRRSLEKDGFVVRAAPRDDAALDRIGGPDDILLVDRARPAAVNAPARPIMHEEILCFADVSMDLVAHRVERAGRDIHLGPTEYRLLQFLLQHPQRVFSRHQLLEIAFVNNRSVELRTIDSYIRRLRKALNRRGDADIVRTVRSAGYALDIA